MRESVSIADCRVLVVEDNALNRQLIAAHLMAAGITNLAFATDGVEGLEKLPEFDPDLVILDIMMPRMDGFQFLEHMRADADFADVPVLVETALEQPEKRNAAFTAGANDLITKPINAVEMIARVRIHLENRLMVESLKDFRDRVESELLTARAMQEAMLPTPDLMGDMEERYGLCLDAHFETSSELGGDIWGLHPVDGHRVGVFTVDFSGHGVNAALNTFRLHALMGQIGHGGDDPAEYLSSINRQLVHLLPRGQFATMFYGVIDTAADTLTYSASAAPSPMIGHLSSDSVEARDASGLPLGMIETARYETRTLDFPTGSFLFLYSDALHETTDSEGRALAEEGVLELVHDALETGGEAPPLASVMERFDERMVRPLPDDLTLIWLTRR